MISLPFGSPGFEVAQVVKYTATELEIGRACTVESHFIQRAHAQAEIRSRFLDA